MYARMTKFVGLPPERIVQALDEFKEGQLSELEGQEGFQGQAADIDIHAQEILNIRRRLDELYADHTGQSIEQVNKDMDRDRYMKPDEALEYGLIDRVISQH